MSEIRNNELLLQKYKKRSLFFIFEIGECCDSQKIKSKAMKAYDAGDLAPKKIRDKDFFIYLM